MVREKGGGEEEKNLSLSLLRAAVCGVLCAWWCIIIQLSATCCCVLCAVCGVRYAVCAVLHTNTGVTLLLAQVHTDRGVAGGRVEEMGESGGTGRGTGHPR